MEAVQAQWLEEKVEGWRDLVDIIPGATGMHLQIAYSGLRKYPHQEWDFVQRVTPDI